MNLFHSAATRDLEKVRNNTVTLGPLGPAEAKEAPKEPPKEPAKEKEAAKKKEAPKEKEPPKEPPKKKEAAKKNDKKKEEAEEAEKPPPQEATCTPMAADAPVIAPVVAPIAVTVPPAAEKEEAATQSQESKASAVPLNQPIAVPAPTMWPLPIVPGFPEQAQAFAQQPGPAVMINVSDLAGFVRTWATLLQTPAFTMHASPTQP